MNELAYEQKRLNEVDSEGKAQVKKAIRQIKSDIKREREKNERTKNL